MEGTAKILARPVKVKTDDKEANKILLGKELPEWVHRTSKLSINTENLYNIIPGQRMSFTRSKLEILKGWEEILESLDVISLLEGTKGLLFKHDDD